MSVETMEPQRSTETGQILKISDEAVRAARRFLEAEGLDKSLAGVRVSVQAGGCSGFKYSLLVEDKPAEDDTVERHQDVGFFVDPFSAQYLQGVVVDYVSTMTTAGFKFTNPNSTGGCGCGSSFSA